VNALAFSPDGSYFASGSDDKTAKIHDAKTLQCSFTLVGHEGGISWISISPDSLTLATASYDESIKLWNSRDGQCKATLKGHSRSVCPSPSKFAFSFCHLLF
jgi:WD40 repeat protein